MKILKIRWYLYLILMVLIFTILIQMSVLTFRFIDEDNQPVGTNDLALHNHSCDVPTHGAHLDYLEKTVTTNDKVCFLKVLEAVHFANESERTLISDWLRKHLLERLDNMFKDPQVKLQILNLIVPVELASGKKDNMALDRQYLISKISVSQSSDKALAIVILGYYKNDKDIAIIKTTLHNSSEDVIVSAIIALVHNCSLQAQEAIEEVLQYTEVIKYLQRYKSKETMSKLIRDECPEAIDQ